MEEVNVSVAVRVRPLLPSERLNSHQVCLKKVQRSKNQLLLGKDRAFTFDNLFWWNSTQQEIYNSTVLSLVEGCFQGYNATVFAYGQTGSGKTYTIGGANVDNKDEEGIIPKAVTDIFNHMKTSKNHVQYITKVSYVEIYMEEVRDLLEADLQKSRDVHIREDQNGNTVIVGAKEETCHSADDIKLLLKKGSALRHTASTQMNQASSRSHAIFTIQIIQTWPVTPRPQLNDEIEDNIDPNELDNIENVMSAKFHFVDLAGSERANRTGNTGERFKESVQINTGLLALGNVISALSDPKKKGGYIPYRDSKITRLLKDSLGGNARTLMIACISPCSINFDESLNVLKYATRAKNIKNKPIVNRDPQQILMEEMQDEIESLKQQLQSRSSTRSAMNDNHLDLERELSDLQDHCSSYQHHLKEAARHLKTVCNSNKKISKGNLNAMRKWLEDASKIGIDIKESMNCNGSLSVSINSSLMNLNCQVAEYKDTLNTSDEAIFDEFNEKISELKKQLYDAESDREQKEQAVNVLENIRQLQDQKIIEQSVVIEQLQEELSYTSSKLHDLGIDPLAERTSQQNPQSIMFGRAQSVPQPLRNGFSYLDAEKRAHSSPPLMSIERVMAGFRARNHLITEQIEEEDEVEHTQFESTNENNQDDKSKHSIISKEDNSIFQENAVKVDFSIQDTNSDEEPELNKLRESTILSIRSIKQSQLRAQNANMKIKELSVNIKMKEQLIKELVKTGHDAEAVKRTYAARISELEKKVESAKSELLQSHKIFREKQNSKADEKELLKLKTEYEHKLRDAKTKVQSLQKRQKEIEKMSTIPVQNKKRIHELETGIAGMRQMQEDMHKKLKDEQDQKRKLEVQLGKDKAKIKELETKNENQQKIVKRKTEEVAAFKKKMRVTGTKQEIDQKQWLDEEINKALEQQELLKQLEAALKAREAAVKKKEEAFQRKSQLEVKKMRSSQILSSEVIQTAAKLSSIDAELSARSQQLLSSMNDASDRAFSKQQQLKKVIEKLQNEKSQLEEKRKHLEVKLQNGQLLNSEDERELIELDEAVEALNAAIEWEDQEILHSQDLKKSQILIKKKQTNSLMDHFKSLPEKGVYMLLMRCFDRIIELRKYEKHTESKIADLENKCQSRDRIIQESENALHHVTIENDRKTTQIQKEHEKQTRQLIQQLANIQTTNTHDENNNKTKQLDAREYQKKIESLEKDLFYYKSTSRELKKKLREFVSDESASLSARSNQSDVEKDNGSQENLPQQSIKKTHRDASTDLVDASVIPRKISSPERQGHKALVRQSSGDATLSTGVLPIQSPKSGSQVAGTTLRRAQISNQTSIPSNSIDYMELQQLSLQAKSNSGKKSSPLHDVPSSPIALSHPLNQGFNHSNLITASLNIKDKHASMSGLLNDSIETESGIPSQIRILKKELKRVPKSEINQRKLSSTLSSPNAQNLNFVLSSKSVQDSLDNNRNPWSN